MDAPASGPEQSWKSTSATVVGCRRTLDSWLVDESAPDEFGSYSIAKFVIHFSYPAVGRVYAGKYIAGSPKEIGETFEIMFNASSPKENTGSDKDRPVWLHGLAAVVGIAVTLLLIKLLPDANW